VNNFRKEYVFAGLLAQELDVPNRTIAAKLRALGIQAVSGPGIDGGVAYLYRRSEVSEIRRDNLIDLPPLRRSRRRKSDIYKATADSIGISVSEAAIALHFNRGQILRLVNAGLLDVEHDLRRRLVINKDSLARYQRELADPEFVPIEIAASAVNETLREFIARWVATGFVEPRDLVVSRYIRLTDLEHIQRTKSEYITLPEIRRLSGGHDFVIKWVRSARLKPAFELGEGNRRVVFFSRDETLSLLARTGQFSALIKDYLFGQHELR
jgi:hypothetical protein